MAANANQIGSAQGQLASLPVLDEKQRYTVTETAAYLRISRARLYEHIASGEIRTLMDGRRRFIPGSEIAARSRLA
jgi:excisionase family DNA binding protein